AGQRELTAERFVPNPFISGTRMYKTGDLARWLPGGLIEYCGRKDGQVKFNGHRIELDEIRLALNAHPEVKDSAVALEQSASGETLVAYYVTDAAIRENDLRESLRNRIIAAMVPSVFVPIDRLPLTPNGKVDFRALALAKKTPVRAKQEASV